MQLTHRRKATSIFQEGIIRNPHKIVMRNVDSASRLSPPQSVPQFSSVDETTTQTRPFPLSQSTGAAALALSATLHPMTDLEPKSEVTATCCRHRSQSLEYVRCAQRLAGRAMGRLSNSKTLRQPRADLTSLHSEFEHVTSEDFGATAGHVLKPSASCRCGRAEKRSLNVIDHLGKHDRRRRHFNESLRSDGVPRHSGRMFRWFWRRACQRRRACQ